MGGQHARAARRLIAVRAGLPGLPRTHTLPVEPVRVMVEQGRVDIHKPKPVHSWREFATELATIIVGILIALALESALEAWRGEALVAHAREDFRVEIAANRDKLEADLKAATATQAKLNALIAASKARLQHQPPPAAGAVNLDRMFVSLQDSAWTSALSVQVLARFPHRQARAIAAVYSDQAEFSALQRDAVRIWVELAGYVIDGDEASEVDIRNELREATISLVYLQSLATTEKQLRATCDTALATIKP